MSDNVDIWLWLTLVMKPNSARLGLILESCGYDAAKAGTMIRDGRETSLTESEKSRAKAIRIGTVHDYKNFCKESGITIISYESEDYPKLLKQIENPPPVLFALGNAKGLNDMPVLTGVGTRRISDYGIAVIDFLTKPLAESGVIIASGTAEGADTAFHNACINAGGRSFAFPGCGVLENHPAGCEELKKRIVENGGAVISELMPDTKASISYFRRRDAVLAGVCSGALIAEAGEKSGSLVTAEYVRKLDRKLFCVTPNNILSQGFEGNVMLIRSGAAAVFDSLDIAEKLEVKLKNAPQRKKAIIHGKSPAAKPAPVKNGEKAPAKAVQKAPAKTVAKAPVKAAPKVPEKRPGVMSEEELSKFTKTQQLVIKSLYDKPRSNEMVMNATGLKVDVVFMTLMDLECSGVLALDNDGYYYIPNYKYE